MLFKADFFSVWGIFGSAIGGLLGIWIKYRQFLLVEKKAETELRATEMAEEHERVRQMVLEITADLRTRLEFQELKNKDCERELLLMRTKVDRLELELRKWAG